MSITRIELTPKFISYILIAALVLLGAWELRSVIVSVFGMLFIAFILSAGFRPLVDALQKRGMARGLAMALIYFSAFVIIALIIFLLARELVNQVVNLIYALPGMFSRVKVFLETSFPFIGDILPFNVLEQELDKFVKTALDTDFVKGLLSGENVLAVFTQTLGVFSTVAELIISFFTVIIISVYMVQKKDPAYEGLLELLPKKQAESIRNLLQKIEVNLGSWLVGQLALMFIVGSISYLLLMIPGIFDVGYTLDDYALPIALLAGLLEALPNVGPTITLVITVILALGSSGLASVIYVAVSFTLLQNIEGVFIVPMIMKKAIGVDPILSIVGILAGFQIAGVVGAILAIPMIGIFQILINEVSAEYKRLERQRPKLVE